MSIRGRNIGRSHTGELECQLFSEVGYALCDYDASRFIQLSTSRVHSVFPSRL
jgi:hypothetical protein